MSAVAGPSGLVHGRPGGLVAAIRGDGEQVGSLAAGAGRDEQAGGHGREPADPHGPAARRAADLQPTGPAGIPPGHADHDPGDGVEGSVPLIQSQDQPRQLRSRVGRPGPPAASSSMRAERSGCRHSRGLDDGVKLIAVRRSVAAGMACPSRT